MHLRTALLAVLALCFVALTGCPDDSDGEADSGPADTTVMDVADGAGDDGGDGATDGSTDAEADVDTGPRCPDAPDCGEDERLVGCDRCVDKMDRRCETDHDCRPDEECRKFGSSRVCYYEPDPVRTCPGSEGCPDSDGPLQVGAASKVVTPQGFERPKPAGIGEDNYINFSPSNPGEEEWYDCGQDGICPGDEDYPGADEGEGDGVAQGMWIAGFSTGRPAQYCPADKIGCEAADCCVSKYAHDNLKVQVVVVRRGGTTVAFASVDTVGWFHTDIEEIRRRLADAVDVDLLVMAGTHNHEAPDTAGQWGPGNPLPERTGRSERFIEKIYSQTVAGIEEAIEGMEPAEAQATVLDVGVDGLAVDDSRPPYVFNDDVPVVRFTAKEDGSPIATMLSFANHAEVLWSSNPYITADYPYYVRKYIREGLEAVTDEQGNEVKPALSGFGGVTLFYAGTVGGLINPGDGGAKDYAGEAPEEDHSFAAADALGQQLASRVLQAHEGGEFDKLDQSDLSFATKQFLTPIKNRVFQLAAYQLGVLKRDVYNAKRGGIGQYHPGLPQLLTEVNVIRLGPVTFFTAPGEVFPETLTGGFPGKGTAREPVVGDVQEIATPAVCDEQGLPVEDGTGTHPCIVKPDQENPPDWSNAPSGPYVYDKIPGQYPFFIGLGGDFLGYFVPNYDYEVDNYLDQAPGSHYEETQGVGPKVIDHWKSNLDTCLQAVSE